MSKPKCHLNSNVTKTNTLEKLKCHKKLKRHKKNETAQKLQSKVCLDQQFCRVKSTLLHKLEEQKNQVTMYLQGNFPMQIH